MRTVERLALAGEEAGLTVERMIQILNAGVSVEALLDIIGRLQTPPRVHRLFPLGHLRGIRPIWDYGFGPLAPHRSRWRETGVPRLVILRARTEPQRGQTVQFDVTKGPKSFQAENVRSV